LSTRRILVRVVPLSTMRESFLSELVVSGLVCAQVCSLRLAQVGGALIRTAGKTHQFA